MNLHLILCVVAGVIITASLLWGKNGLAYVKANPVAFAVQGVLGIVGTFIYQYPAVQYTIYIAAVIALGLAIANNKKP